MRQTPENRSMPVAEWPDFDRERWIAATAHRNIFDSDCNSPSQWSGDTRKGYAHGYGQWLNWLHREDPFVLFARPAERASLDRLKAYHQALTARSLADFTVAGRIRSIGQALVAIEPDHDWAWIERAADRLHGRARHKKDIREILQPASEVLDLGFSLMEEEGQGDGASTAGGYGSVRYRDGLMIALLILCPLRRRNLASLALGHGLERQGDVWRVRIPAEETKTRREIYWRWPVLLDDALDHYLTVHLRNGLCSNGGCLWQGDLSPRFPSHCRDHHRNFGTGTNRPCHGRAEPCLDQFLG
jgi:integrase